MVEQILFYVSFPFIWRWKNGQKASVQDLFIATILASGVYFSFGVGCFLGLIVHLYGLLDAILYKEMGLRLCLGHLAHLRNGFTLWASARSMGRKSYLAWFLGLLVVHGLHAMRGDAGAFSWEVSVCVGLLTVFFWQGGYEIDHPIIYAFRRVGLKKERQKPLSMAPLSFEGPKLPLSVKGRPHVVFLFLESFAQTAICEEVTPRFMQLAQQGLYFPNHYANGTITYRIYLSALFGVPAAGTVQGLGPYVGARLEGIPELMRKAGYQTAFHHNGSLGFDRQRDFLKDHFDHLSDRAALVGSKGGWGVEDEHLMRFSADWLQKQTAPTFLTLFTITNHHPWVVPEGYNVPSFGYGAKSPKERFYQTMHYSDFCLGLLADLLKEQNAILFVLGDHGQPMGQHRDNFYNSRFLYEENIRVPLLILAPGQSPQVFSEPTSHLDLLPTMADLMNVEMKAPQAGTSLLRPIRERPIFFQNPYSEGFWGCRKGSWKWVGENLSGKQELYRLDQDPLETVNLIEEHSDKAFEMKRETETFFQSVEAFYQERKNIPQTPSLELDLSHKLIKDSEVVERVAQDLRILSLDHCHLLTDAGIVGIFEKCPQLEWVSLRGLSDLTDRSLRHVPESLERLNMADAAQISDEGLVHLAQRCPRLRVLSVKGENLTDRGLLALGPGLIRFEMQNGPHITEEGWISFFQKNRQINRLTLHNCPQFTDRVREFLNNLSVEKIWVD